MNESRRLLSLAAEAAGAELGPALELADEIRCGVEAMRVPWKGSDLALYRAKAAGKNRVCS